MSPDTRVARPGERPGRPGQWSTALRDVAPLIGIGTTLAVTVVLGLGVGYWVDRRLGTEPWFLLVGGLLGMILAFYQFYRTVAGLRK